jgi:hypothetical protein|tara:strand:+ start:1359 stop:1559 length:201 start_codon:yes stop_codon:yes gene_type:complete
MIEITSNDFESYEGVREYGKWNMFDPNARKATGLEKDVYITIIRHYDELKSKFGKEEQPWASMYMD